ncbi:MAG: hypothetical protein ACTHLZ_18305 [Tepidisphaeraceae bacterium]
MTETNTPSSNLPAVIVPEPTTPPRQQLGDLPIEEIRSIADEFGLDGRGFDDKAELIAAIHRRRQLIASLDKAALVDVLHWAGRTPLLGAVNEQLAIEIVQIKSMRFTGLSDRGLFALALLRGCEVSKVQSRDDLIKELKAQEGFFNKMKRKTRGWLGKRVQSIIGDETTALPPVTPATPGAAAAAPRAKALKEEIEESGFFGGIANRVKRQADSYVNQKLDEIEARIDRKLDEIDRRLAEWRDKEIANRIRILKITLWVSVVVAVISLIYSYIQVETKVWRQQTPTHPSTTPTSLMAPADTTNAKVARIEIRTSRSSMT